MLICVCVGATAYAAVDYLAQYAAEISTEAAAAAAAAEPVEGLAGDEVAAYRLGFAFGYDYALEMPDGTGTTRSRPAAGEETYIVNVHTDRFHLPNCQSVKNIKERNRYTYTSTRQLLIDLGFYPCQNCKP